MIFTNFKESEVTSSVFHVLNDNYTTNQRTQSMDDSEPPVSVSPLCIQDFITAARKNGQKIGGEVASVVSSTVWKGSSGGVVLDLFGGNLPDGLAINGEGLNQLNAVAKSWSLGGQKSSLFGSKVWGEICEFAPLLSVALSCCTQKLHDFIGDQIEKALDGGQRQVSVTSRSIQVDGGKALVHTKSKATFVVKKVGTITAEFLLEIAFLPSCECERADLQIISFQAEGKKKEEPLRQHLLLCGFPTKLLQGGEGSDSEDSSDDDDDDDDDDLYDDDEDEDDDDEADLFCLKEEGDPPTPTRESPKVQIMPDEPKEVLDSSPPSSPSPSPSPSRPRSPSPSPSRSTSPSRPRSPSPSPSRSTSPSPSRSTSPSPSPSSSSSPSSSPTPSSPTPSPTSPAASSSPLPSQSHSPPSSPSRGNLSPQKGRSTANRASPTGFGKGRISPSGLGSGRDVLLGSSGGIRPPLKETSGGGGGDFARSMGSFPKTEAKTDTNERKDSNERSWTQNSERKPGEGTWKFSLGSNKRRAMNTLGRREENENEKEEKEKEKEKEEVERGRSRLRSDLHPDPVSAVPPITLPKTKEFELLNSETILNEKPKVLYLGGNDRETWLVGRLLVTNCRIIWINDDWANQPKPFYSNFVCGDLAVHIPYSMIYKMEAKKKKKKEAFSVSTYIFGFHQFQFRSQAIKNEVVSFIRDTIPYSIHNFFAFSHRPFNNVPSVNGWNIFSEEKEYSRFFISSTKWRMSRANVGYALCDTYPEILCVPEAITDDELVQIAQFRSRGRFPVMTWRHPVNTATLSRCAQPRVGLKGKRCDEDERLLSLMLETNESNNNQIWLMDARPRVNAMANAAMGAGVEDAKIYDMVKIKFLGIENIHAMRKSFSSLFDLCRHSSAKSLAFFSTLESTKWMEYIRLILRSAVRIVRLIHVQHTNVIIHCSDGWDRTPQLSSLSIIMMDPYPRTMLGFFRLIEMEWASFGHKFCDRLGHMVGMKESEMSPVFLQFIDCVYQIMVQFPTEFEFNEIFLMCLLYHANSSQFGTFLFNTPKARKDSKVRENTTSLWTYILSEKEIFTNPLYKYSNGAPKHDSVLVPRVALMDLTFWKEFYVGGSSRSAFFQRASFMKEKMTSSAGGTVVGDLGADNDKPGHRTDRAYPGSRSPKMRTRNAGESSAVGLSPRGI